MKSDKEYWHGFIPFYEGFFKDFEPKNIAEIGIYQGDSIRWLLDRFPKADVFGADIIEKKEFWPKCKRFYSVQLDQADSHAVMNFFKLRQFDLMIEDGSHDPFHQGIALLEGMRELKSGGIYILEDIHTSHKAILAGKMGNTLSTLLAIDHYKRIDKTPDFGVIADGSMFEDKEIKELWDSIGKMSLYKRTHLPDNCYSCGSVDYNFHTYKCKCGAGVFDDTDSMTFVLIKA
jgi:hypothetical protein